MGGVIQRFQVSVMFPDLALILRDRARQSVSIQAGLGFLFGDLIPDQQQIGGRRDPNEGAGRIRCGMGQGGGNRPCNPSVFGNALVEIPHLGSCIHQDPAIFQLFHDRLIEALCTQVHFVPGNEQLAQGTIP